jgi:hypothetical protein
LCKRADSDLEACVVDEAIDWKIVDRIADCSISRAALRVSAVLRSP